MQFKQGDRVEVSTYSTSNQFTSQSTDLKQMMSGNCWAEAWEGSKEQNRGVREVR